MRSVVGFPGPRSNFKGLFILTMREEIKTVFYCDHCSKKYLKKSAMALHERFCMKSPDNVPMCFKGYSGCKHFRNWNCAVFDKSLCTPRYAYLHRTSRLLEDNDIEVMPKMCARYEKGQISEEEYFLGL